MPINDAQRFRSVAPLAGVGLQPMVGRRQSKRLDLELFATRRHQGLGFDLMIPVCRSELVSRLGARDAFTTTSAPRLANCDGLSLQS